MANRIEGVYERVLECAKEEFLAKGYKDASLRLIAQNAETSTGSIYTRFSDKEGLFKAMVEPVVEELKDWFYGEQTTFNKLPQYIQKEELFDYSEDKNNELVDYIYDKFDIFKLLISCSDGTEFEDFINEFADIEVDFTLKFIEDTNNDAISSGRASTDLIHILASAYYSGLFEIVIHDMTREDAKVYVNQLRLFFTCGWRSILESK